MIAAQILQLVLWLFIIPLCVGSLFLSVDKKAGKLPLAWISGQLLLWAVFQLICVPLILIQADYSMVQQIYLVAVAALFLFSMVRQGIRFKKGAVSLRLIKEFGGENKNLTRILWAVFWALLFFQLFQAVRMTYADGDDAFYVAVTTITENADTMYTKQPYTGGTSELDIRHGIAPFPIWITFLAKMSGFRPVGVAHVAVPLALITMTYDVFYLMGQKLCGKYKERLPLFLIFTEILVLFGDTSYYTVENFMIARSRQGKAALGSIIIPALFFLLLLLLEQLQNGQKFSFCYWVLLAAAMTVCCLCSTMGALLCCMLVGIVALCGAVCYRKWKFLFPTAICCAPCVLYAALYLLLT
ncbi:MAG: hypothetical protein J1E64_03695 [Acetatifactor sp.]|nr:hypothetical protein [Acetatifactor sp.]